MNTNSPEVLRTATCRSCGYSLRGLTRNVCPECGRSFNPSDPSTFRDRTRRSAARRARRIQRWRRRAQPPSTVYIVIAWIATSYLLLMSLDPQTYPWRLRATNQDVLPHELALLAIVVVALATRRGLARYLALMHLCRLKQASDKSSRSPRTWRIDKSQLACVLALSAWMFAWPMQLRFQLSRSALCAAAAARIAEGSSAKENRWIGLFHVNAIYLHSGGQVFFNTSYDETFPTGMSARFGLLYEPRGKGWQLPRRLGCLGPMWSVADLRRAKQLVIMRVLQRRFRSACLPR